MQARSLCWEGPLEEGMVTHSQILAWMLNLCSQDPGCNAISQDKCYPIICELLCKLSEAMVPAIKEFYGGDVCVDV